jgi:scyllo-inositol 2-dehydrogenase (NADP+)
VRVIVVGLGVQGAKRKKVAGPDFVAAVDPVNADAEFRNLQDVPVERYDAALCCIPDGPKIELLTYLAEHGKHALVEKPLWAADDAAIGRLEALARKNGVVLYTAYNHRFEPHYVAMRDLIASARLGRLYHCRMLYGNGTARLVRESEWRDHGSGVLHDLGSHLLDTARFWFGELSQDFRVVFSSNHENRAPDHVVIACDAVRPKLELEMSLLCWRNHFTCDLVAENGSAHIASLCKWGPTSFTVRTRVLPSGPPPEETVTLVQDDPTWEAEYAHFKGLVAMRAQTDLGADLWLNRLLRRLGDEAIARMSR